MYMRDADVILYRNKYTFRLLTFSMTSIIDTFFRAQRSLNTNTLFTMMNVHKSLIYCHLDVPQSCHSAVCQRIIAVAMSKTVVAATPAVEKNSQGCTWHTIAFLDMLKRTDHQHMLCFGFWSPAWDIGVLVCPQQTALLKIKILFTSWQLWLNLEKKRSYFRY